MHARVLARPQSKRGSRIPEQIDREPVFTSPFESVCKCRDRIIIRAATPRKNA